MKKCSDCGISKNKDQFHRDKCNPDGYFYVCKVCVNSKAREQRRISFENRKPPIIDGVNWKPIVGFEKYYYVSDSGLIFSVRQNKFLSPGKNRKGYRQTILNGDGGTGPQAIRIHRQVAIHFINNLNNFEQVNHIDGNKENNAASNLEWCTGHQNIQHSITSNLRRFHTGCAVYNSRFTETDVRKIRSLLKSGMKHIDISRLFEVSKSTVTAINCGRSYKNVV